MAKYRLSNTAKDDLIRIHQYGLVTFGQTQADKYLDQFFDHIEIIAQRPLAFEAVDFIRPGYRRCVSGSDSIFYKIDNETVEIMAIVGRQNINEILK